MADKKLIVNADDFGWSEAVNRAVARAHEFGTVTSASLMPCGPAFSQAVEISREHGDLGIGLHFTLTQGRPVADPGRVSTLCDSRGRFFSRGGLLRRLLLGRIQRDHIQTELEAQIGRADEAGVSLTHLDGHQHVHVFPAIFGLVLKLARQRGLALRVPSEERLAAGTGGPSRLKPGQLVRKSFLRPFCFFARRRSRRVNIRVNDHFRSYFGLSPAPEQVSLEACLRLVEGLRPGLTELMVHPALEMGDIQLWGQGEAIRRDRGCEAEVLLDPRFKAALQTPEIDLIHYGDL